MQWYEHYLPVPYSFQAMTKLPQFNWMKYVQSNRTKHLFIVVIQWCLCIYAPAKNDFFLDLHTVFTHNYIWSLIFDDVFTNVEGSLQNLSALYILTYAHRYRWSIGHQRPLALELCSGLLWSFRTSCSLSVSALLQCLTSNCCEAGLSSSSPAGSRSGFSVWCWMLAFWGCVRSSPTSSAISAWPLVPIPLASTDLYFGSSLAIGFWRCASDRCWRKSWSFVASSVLFARSHIRRVGLTSHWSWRCGVWFSCRFIQIPRCFWAWRKLLLPCRFWLWRLGLCLPVGQPRFPGRRKTPPPWWALHQLWLVRWQCVVLYVNSCISHRPYPLLLNHINKWLCKLQWKCPTIP